MSDDFPKNRRRMQILRRLMQKANGRCFYCKRQVVIVKGSGLTLKATIDHVVPKSKGGKLNRHNTVLACAFCNETRATMPQEEFLAMIAVAQQFGVPMQKEPKSRAKFLDAVRAIVMQQEDDL